MGTKTMLPTGVNIQPDHFYMDVLPHPSKTPLIGTRDFKINISTAEPGFLHSIGVDQHIQYAEDVNSKTPAWKH